MDQLFSFQEWRESQQRSYQRIVQAYAAYEEARRRSRPFHGGMHWKTIKGRQYLYQYRDRQGHGASLGPRSPRTEEIFRVFQRERRQAADQLQAQRRRLEEEARFCRAARLRRVPTLVTRILRRLEEEAGEQNFLVIDTQALYAYEFAAGVFLEGSPAGALWGDAAAGLTLATDQDTAPAHLLALLRRADRSFQPLPGPAFRAVNRAGFLVQVVTPASFSPAGAKTQGPGGAGRLAHLLGSPKFSRVVIGWDGTPVVMVAPDPRALALHQLWLSQQPGREARQRTRERDQALAVAALILKYLPQYHFYSADLRLFPAEIFPLEERSLAEFASTSDLGIEY